MFRCAAESKAMNHDTRRSREEATGTPKARQTGVVPSIILINAVSIIVIALTCRATLARTRFLASWRTMIDNTGFQPGRLVRFRLKGSDDYETMQSARRRRSVRFHEARPTCRMASDSHEGSRWSLYLYNPQKRSEGLIVQQIFFFVSQTLHDFSAATRCTHINLFHSSRMK